LKPGQAVSRLHGGKPAVDVVDVVVVVVVVVVIVSKTPKTRKTTTCTVLHMIQYGFKYVQSPTELLKKKSFQFTGAACL